MKDLIITNNYQEKLAALLVEPSEGGKNMVVICHGFRGTKENGGRIFTLAKKLQQLGMGVVAFDFRGSGSSDGDFEHITLSRQADDLKTVLDYVHDQYSLPIIALGRSFGGSTVLAGGGRDPRIAGYILWSTPFWLEQTFAQIIPEEFRDMQKGKKVKICDAAGDYHLYPDLVQDFACHAMATYLEHINNRPVLIVHAHDDEVVEPGNAIYIHGKLKNSELFLLDNAGHRFQEKTALREQITIDWLKDRFVFLHKEASKN